MNVSGFVTLVAVSACLSGCATTSSTGDGGSSEGKSSPSSKGKFSSPESSDVDDDDLGAYADSRSFVQSLSNNPMTSRTIRGQKVRAAARQFATQTKGTSAQNLNQFENLIAAERISGVSTLRLLSHLERLAASTIRGKAGETLSEKARLEVALGALQQGQYSMSTFFLGDLLSAKNKRVKAGAYNAMGIIAIRENRVPEAVEYWRQALKAVSGYEAALLNLGFISLKFGHFENSRRYLSRISKDWFVQSGLLVASRLTSKTGDTAKYCARLLRDKPGHKPTLFNCGIHEWQSNNNIPKAKKLISKALNTRGGPSSWEQRGYKTLEKVR